MKALTFYSALSVFFFGKTKQIKEADKGEAVVIMDRDYYESKIIEMLLNPEFYSKISENQDKKNPMQNIKRLLLKHSSVLAEKVADFLSNFDYKESCFFGLPKNHESKLIKDAVAKQNSEYFT